MLKADLLTSVQDFKKLKILVIKMFHCFFECFISDPRKKAFACILQLNLET